MKGKSDSLESFKLLAKKYNVSSSGSRKQIADKLAMMRASYMTKKERLLILPFLSNNKNKKIFIKNINNPKKQMPSH